MIYRWEHLSSGTMVVLRSSNSNPTNSCALSPNVASMLILGCLFGCLALIYCVVIDVFSPFPLILS